MVYDALAYATTPVHDIASPPPMASSRHWENSAVVPAHLLPLRQTWQTLTNKLPKGTILVCLPPHEPPAQQTMQKIVSLLRHHGHHVRVIAADQLTQPGEKKDNDDAMNRA